MDIFLNFESEEENAWDSSATANGKPQITF